ncbi:enoyl-CoA hydratase [Tenggerimyces flavus]|uniref:Enoyl-CoA hydratase n=1 Tax=Tenggerimyces flavus TaxID=1708749 RepID=A0ABV7YES3_9ACTN|nr:enoyl-CoA hydratase [Tenggerimyces flavus]MBM7789001.1 enoyl-CoA hydratase/carnithine racemase [Tenggerimyces flavus]
MATSELLTSLEDGVLTVTFNRPEQRNAMTWAMYEGLVSACSQADADPSVRVLVLRGAGSKAFVAGTDISQFSSFASGDDGVAYEHRIAGVLDRLESVTKPTLAVVRGYCVGGGLGLAGVCDLRVASSDAQFGVPIARTLGNCLSMNGYSLLVANLGRARTLDLLLRSRLLSASEALSAGFVSEVCEPSELDALASRVIGELLSHSPLSMWAAKEALGRLRRSSLPDGDDIVARVFGSEDFRSAVQSFVAKEKPTWTGR